MNEMKEFLMNVKNHFHQKLGFFASASLIIISLDAIIFMTLLTLILSSLHNNNTELLFLKPINALQIFTLTAFPIPLFAAVLGLLISPSLKHKKHLTNINWLKEKNKEAFLYHIFLIKQLTKHFQNLNEVQELILNLEAKKMPDSEIDYFAHHFYFQKKKKIQTKFINEFIEMNQSYLNKSIEELELMLQDKITHYITQSQENKIINNFVASKQVVENKTLSLNI
jgi:hypothetical protein